MRPEGSTASAESGFYPNWSASHVCLRWRLSRWQRLRLGRRPVWNFSPPMPARSRPGPQLLRPWPALLTGYPSAELPERTPIGTKTAAFDTPYGRGGDSEHSGKFSLAQTQLAPSS